MDTSVESFFLHESGTCSSCVSDSLYLKQKKCDFLVEHPLGTGYQWISLVLELSTSTTSQKKREHQRMRENDN